MSFVLTTTGGFLAATVAGFILPFVAALLFQRDTWRTTLPLLFALALIGACAGFAGGMSRSPAVGDIIPAFLGLLGAVAVYLFGVDQSRGVIASFGAAALSLSLFIGYAVGAEQRLIPEDHRDIRAHCARAFTDAELLGDTTAFERFWNQMGGQCMRAMHWNITPPTDKEGEGLMRALLTLAVACSTAFAAQADDITIVTWNIANLHHETGVALRDRAFAREDIDYERLANVVTGLDGDIFALQEIGSPAALARIFPADAYHLVLSERYQPGTELKPADERDIFTAVAIAKDTFPELPTVTTVDAFALQHMEIDRDGQPSIRPTRSAIQVDFTLGGQAVSLLNVHLKSSCHDYPLSTVEDQNFFTGRSFGSRFDCRTLKAQQALLENWIELQHAQDRGVIVAGDFNRRMNLAYRNPTRHEDFWADLNDGQPDNLMLTKGPLGLDQVCWPNHPERFVEHIDFIIMSDVVRGAFGSFEYAKHGLGFDDAPEYAAKAKERLSDHCPVTLTLRL